MYNNLLPEVRKQTNRNRGSTSLVHSRDCNQGNRVTREVSWCVDHTKNLNQFLFATTSSPLSRKLPSKHLLNNSQYGDCRLLQETPVYPVSTPKTVRTKISKKKRRISITQHRVPASKCGSSHHFQGHWTGWGLCHENDMWVKLYGAH